MLMDTVRSSSRRLAGFGWSALRANYQDLPLPYRLFLYVTDACNCRCNMCNIWQKPTDHELNFDELSRTLRSGAHFIRWMDITGGEIFLRPDILDLFKLVADALPKLFMFHFATNGSMPERVLEAAQVIRRSPIPQFIVTVSLDGPEDLHNQIRGIPGLWRRCLTTFQELRRARVPVVFGMTLTEHNHDQYQATVAAVQRVLPDIGHRDFHVNLPQISDLYYDNRSLIAPPMALILKSVQQIHALRGFSLHPVNLLERAFLHHARAYVETQRSPMVCEALSSSVVLGTRGELFPCIIYNKSVGNVRQHQYSLEAVWQQQARQKLRTEIRQGQCPHCWTPCEAYQTLLANTLPGGKNRGKTSSVVTGPAWV